MSGNTERLRENPVCECGMEHTSDGDYVDKSFAFYYLYEDDTPSSLPIAWYLMDMLDGFRDESYQGKNARVREYLRAKLVTTNTLKVTCANCRRSYYLEDRVFHEVVQAFDVKMRENGYTIRGRRGVFFVR